MESRLTGKASASVPAAITLFCFIAAASLAADEGDDRGTSLSAGFGITDTAGNFGVALEISSPTFLYDFMTVRLQGNMDFASGAVFATGDHYWQPFGSIRAGLAAGSGMVIDLFRYYGEFGALTLIPSPELDSQNLRVGAYGIFGFEFFVSEEPGNPVAYYIELGSAGVNTRADQLPANPYYYNGFHTAVGTRFYF